MTRRHAAEIWLLRVPGWAAIALVTAVSAHPLWAQLSSGIAVALAGASIQFAGDERPMRTNALAVVTSSVLGLASVLLAPGGLGEVPVYFAASRIAFPVNRGLGRVFLIADTLAVAAVVGIASRSLLGALAGLGVPLVARRAVERRQLIAARDEAQALLVEVQAGREAESQAAALRERGRIARDLHDVLAHSLAGLSLQLQATRAIAARENVGRAVLDPLDKAAALARDGLGEARAVVGALRDPVGLGLDEIPALVARHPAEVDLRVTGDPVPVAPEAGHAAYRAVQEALTNAARYAPGAAVCVDLGWAATGLTLTITDTGLPHGRVAVASQGSGLGLAGMQERLAAAGASVVAGPDAAGGWRVEIRVPARAAVAT